MARNTKSIVVTVVSGAIPRTPATPVRVVDLEGASIAQVFPCVFYSWSFRVGHWDITLSGRGRPSAYAITAIGNPRRLAMRAARWA
eukprot:4991071-Pyramimonas_sp.AAC.1